MVFVGAEIVVLAIFGVFMLLYSLSCFMLRFGQFWGLIVLVLNTGFKGFQFESEVINSFGVIFDIFSV